MKDLVYKTSLFLFRRDLRLHDNHGLAQAVSQSSVVIPCFIFDPRQVGVSNKYRSNNSLQFMVESLEDLNEQLHKQSGRLYCFSGTAEDMLQKLLTQLSIDAVFCNRDYTPFSIKRDKALAAVCSRAGIPFIACDDALLTKPEEVATSSGTPYKTYTPFFRAARKKLVTVPTGVVRGTWYTKTIPGVLSTREQAQVVPHTNSQLQVRGGRKIAEKIMRSLHTFKKYATERDIPSIPTTHLSAYLKFGVVSAREVYHACVEQLGHRHPLIGQLYWRDFFTYTLFHTPEVLGSAGVKKYDQILWSYNKHHFKAWCEGKTGFPIVDAGMRQLNETGFMHNRVRMIVASFLTKDLLIDWRWGEKYFAQQLVDYDPALNNGNWQWVASTGTCAQPYFRVFNPWVQQKKFDPGCLYIKEWVPELKRLEPKVIHTLYKYKEPVVDNYPAPMLDHTVASKHAIVVFKQVH